MRDEMITVFGGSGFVGRALVEQLVERGARVRVAVRRPARAMDVKPLGSLGQIQLIAADVTKPDSVARAVQGASGVVNLVGILAGDFAKVQAAGARHIAEAAATAGAKALVQVSAIGADPASPSRYGRSKAEAEAAVRAAFPAATIIRPSIIFGRGDSFINRFADLIRSAPLVPVVSGTTRFQPVHVADVARAIAIAVTEPARFGGRLFELGGPDSISMRALMEYIAREIGRQRVFVDVPGAAATALAYGTGWAPGAPITPDQLKMLARDNVVAEGAEGFAAFGIAPAPLAAIVPAYLTPYRKHGRFAATDSRD